MSDTGTVDFAAAAADIADFFPVTMSVPKVAPPGYRRIGETTRTTPGPGGVAMLLEHIDDNDPRPRMLCPFCGSGDRSIGAMMTHMASRHPNEIPPAGPNGRRPNGWAYEHFGLDKSLWEGERQRASTYNSPTKKKAKPTKKKAVKTPAATPVAPPPVEDVVMAEQSVDLDRLYDAVLALLFPNEMIPLRLLGQVDMWRAATATLVAAIQGE